MLKPLFECVDCVSLYVDDIDEGVRFYRDSLGLRLLWRTDGACGLGLADDITEVVLVKAHNPTANFKVDSVERALTQFIQAGGRVVYGPFDIDIGKCVVVSDKWDNRYCLLDMTKGVYATDENGNVTGVM